MALVKNLRSFPLNLLLLFQLLATRLFRNDFSSFPKMGSLYFELFLVELIYEYNHAWHQPHQYFTPRIVFVINIVFGMFFSRPQPIKHYIPSC